MIELCMVEHCRVLKQRASQQSFFYNNKLQINDLTSSQVVPSSSKFSKWVVITRGSPDAEQKDDQPLPYSDSGFDLRINYLESA